MFCYFANLLAGVDGIACEYGNCKINNIYGVLGNMFENYASKTVYFRNFISNKKE